MYVCVSFVLTLGIVCIDTAGTQVGSYFPDYFVEGVTLFKRNDRYYVTYGSCCCACRAGCKVIVSMLPTGVALQCGLEFRQVLWAAVIHVTVL